MNETRTVCIRDNGLNFPLACRFRDEGWRVLYQTPWCEAYPDFSECVIGDGFSGIERCDDFWQVKNQIDLFIFPNRGHAGEQLELASQGKLVFGSRLGTDLETYRIKFRKLQAALHMDVPEYNVIVGITKLREYLRPLENKFIKIDRYRHTMETWKWRNWEESHSELDRLAVKFGPFKELVPFIVEDEIKTKIETGGDLISVDGNWPSHGVSGVEYKDKTYIGFLRAWEELDDAIKAVFMPLSEILKALNYRNFLSTEQRITKTDNFLTDITPRLGFPSGNCQTRMYANLPDVIFAGAQGEMIPIEPAAKVAIECLIDHNCSESDWRSFRIPSEALPWVNLINVTKLDHVHHFPPYDVKDTCIGSISGEGDTVEEAVMSLLEHVESLADQPVSIRLDTVKGLLEEIETAQKQGIEITEQPVVEAMEIVSD